MSTSGMSGGSPSSKKAKIECQYGEDCYRKKKEHFEEFTHSHLDRLLKEMGGKMEIPKSYKPKISIKTLTEQLDFVRELSRKCSINDGGDTKKVPEPSCSRSQMKSSEASSCKRVSNDQKPKKEEDTFQGNPAWNSHMKKYKDEAFQRIKFSVSEKMNAVSPYNFFLTTIKDSSETHRQLYSISFPELLDPHFGELESSLQINFMIEFGFVLAQYTITGYKSKPLTLLYGQIDCELGDKFSHFLTHAKVNPPSSFGSHHTKMMIFKYTNKSIRVVVTTSNLVESDWENRTQGLWISPECPALPPDSDTGAGESITSFKKDLLAYLTAYQLPCLQPWLETIRQVDMSPVKVFFVASVPGSHTTHKDNWGQLKLAKLLKSHVVPNKGRVIAQCSSIGSLGPKPSSWLQGEILSTLTATKAGPVPQDFLPLKLIYPTFNCIANSYDGLLGGGCLPYPQATHKKQEWLITYLCDWKCDKHRRTRAPPHIKTYTRVSDDLKKIFYFVLTSANMSKAAWGQKSKSGSLNILSYEAGVVFIPQIMVGKDYFPLEKEEDGAKPFILPYDLPFVPYTYNDMPWFIDHLS